MSSSIFDMLTSQLGGEELDRISRQLGADRGKTETAVKGALGTLLGALAKNAQQDGGAKALANALERDDHATTMDRLNDHLQNPQKADGDGILRHVLGSRRGTVESGISAASGMDSKQVGSMLSMLAPVVMGALGKVKQSNDMGASDLANMLGQEREQIRKKQPVAGDMLSRLLDTDGDGDTDMKDIARHGKGLLGRLFKR